MDDEDDSRTRRDVYLEGKEYRKKSRRGAFLRQFHAFPQPRWDWAVGGAIKYHHPAKITSRGLFFVRGASKL